MRIDRLIVSPWRSNCYLVSADDDATECVVIDPGITCADDLTTALRQRHLVPVAILATHGHVDHVGDAHIIAGQWQVPLYLAEPEHYQLTRPGAGLGPQGDAMMRHILGRVDLPAVADVRDWDGAIEVAGLNVTPHAAPGHTPGSTLLEVASRQRRVLFTGDVLFAGTIGRVDLPGGSMAQMRQTLRRIVEHFSPQMPLLPGHGDPTDLGHEISANPYMQPEL